MESPIIRIIMFIITLGGTITPDQLLKALYEIFTQRSGGSENSRMTRRTNTTIIEEFEPAWR